ncbi:MAG: hypothetical protein LQ346_008642 [Caloplaca aetnensis]|nr:MAG: hypothetical protein LQ346_008642 [Caloplaca aetnensis]
MPDLPSSSVASGGDPYMFKRDHRSMARLNYNHWLHIQLFGYLLHPRIDTPADNSHDGFRVADIGTGTAIYPVALSAEWQRKGLTRLRVDGFDISSAQFPPQAWMPENVRLYVQDAFQPFAPEKHGAYDVVHVRYFSTLVKGHSLQPLVRNLVGLLKPGGYLQWSEPDMSSTKATATSPSTLKGTAEKLSALMKSPRPGVEVE